MVYEVLLVAYLIVALLLIGFVLNRVKVQIWALLLVAAAQILFSAQVVQVTL